MDKYRRKHDIKVFLSIGMILLWFVLIFLLSNQVADDSSAMSGGISEWLWRLVNKIKQGPELEMDLFSHLIRKTAHFTIYLILGILVYNGFYQFKHVVSNKRMLISWLICIGYAISDEVHQYFVPGRSMELSDVVLDSVGAFVGLMLVVLVKVCFKYGDNKIQ